MNDTQLEPVRKPSGLRRDGLALLVMVVVHEALRRSLAGDAIVSALFAPSGPHAWTTLMLGLVFVGVRVALFVVVPGWIVARAVFAVCAERRRETL